MRKIFTQLTTCPEHVEGQNFSVKKAGYTCPEFIDGCPSVVGTCTGTTAHHINNYKDDLANAGSFSFIPVPLFAGDIAGNRQLSTDNFFNRQLSTSNPPTPNKSFMSTLLRRSKFVSLLIAGLFLISNNIIAQSCASNNIGFNSDTTKNALAICIGTTGTTINGSAPGGGATYQYQVSTTSPGTTGYSNAAGTSTTQNYTISSTYYNTAGTYYFKRVVANSSGGCNGSSDVVTLTVSSTSPSSLTYSTNPGRYCVGTAITANSPISSGGAPTSYSVSPALPAGLTLNTTTGVISGTPTATSAASNYTVTATNGCGSTATTVNIAVSSAPPSSLTYSTNPARYCVGTAITNNTPSSSGGAPTSYSISATLPAGLSFNTTTGVISGTPTAASAATNYTVTATNGCGSTSTTVNIAVSSAPPSSLTYSSNPATYCVGTAITANTPSSSGDAPTSYSISATLPAGLSFNTTTGVISGTPTTASAATDYTVTATNGCGSTQATVNIKVNTPPGSLTYSSNPATYCVGTAITNNTPSSSGDAPTSYSISATLPAGLSFNTTTGVISGTPTAASAATNYTVTATNGCGSIQTTVNIKVNTAPSSLTYSSNPATYCVGTAITANTPSSSGTAPTSYSISATLPAGLSFNTTTGVISGTPTAASAATDYTVTATNGCGSTQATVNIKVNTPPSSLTYSSNPATYCVGTAITNNTPSSSGDAPTSYSISATLPAGLSFNTTTGVISGTPTAASAATNYTVTATNGCGSTQTTVNIKVNTAPSSLTYSSNPATYCVGTAITANTPSSGGTAPTSYSISATLPAGLSFNTTTGVISGTPTAASAATDYTVTAANGCGSTQATVNIKVNTPPSSLTYSSNPATYCVGTAITNNTPSSSGDAPTSYSISATLPAGLSFNTTTGVISGTPTAASAATNYTVTATNGCGSTQTTVNIKVNTAPSSLTYSSNPATYCVGTAITANTPSSGGTAPTSYSISATLPAGLSFNTTTGVISGTPTAASAATDYTVTATNGCGSTQATVNIKVNTPPSSLTYSSNPATYCVGTAITNNTPSSSGDAPTSYSISATLPAGLSFNTTTGVISGTPTAASAATNYTVTATNGCGSTQATVNITVNAQPNNVTSGNGFKGNTICRGENGTLTFDAIDASFVTPYTINYTDGTTTWSQTISSASVTTFNVVVNPTTTTTYTLVSITNGNGCTRTSGFGDATAQITVSTVPSFTACPGNQSANTASGVCTAVVNYTATASGTPAPTVTYAFTGATTASGSGTGSGSTFNAGITNVTITANNGCSPNATCTFTVTVNDTQAPAITCPSNITVPNDNNVCGATVTFAATATDNCPGTAVTYSQNPGTVFPIGTTTVTATATDASNNTTTCTFTVTVNDTQAPAITCPSNITVPNDNNVCGATVTFAATATDNCPGTVVTYSQNPGTVFPIGTTTVTATATDASNNKTTCTFTVTVNDTQAPAITCPSNITVPNDNNVCGATVTFAATATDNCAGTAVTYSQNPGTVFPIGTTTVTATATDASNNKTTCTFTVTVNDTQAPAITCPSNITVSNDNNVCGATVTFAATATDNCAGTAVTYSQNPGTVFPIGTTTVTATATDASNNKTTCTFTVTVNDTQAPAITCPSNITVSNDNNVCGATVTFAATATDNCPGTAVTYSQNPGTVFPIGTTTVTATATDASNNKTTCTFTVTVNDTQAPAITCPSNITVSNDNNVCGATVTFAATATDNCPGTAVTYSQNPGTVFPIGTTTVTATATDASNNKTTCTFTVTVNDTQAPAITCPSNITVPNDNNVCGATVTFAATATDNCPGTAVTYSQNPGTVFPIGTTTVTATATDASNNTTTCTFTVTVNDTQAPAITCPSNITVPNDNNVCGATVTFAATATDNCPGTAVTYSQNPGTVFPIGTTTVTATATDASNNKTTCTFTVTVNDTQAPAITCPSNITVPNDNNVCGATVTFAATATDNCAGTVVTYSQNPGTVFPIGTTTVTATATDASNNTTTCTFTVTVNDTQAPAITCPSNITVPNDNNVCGATVTFAATATDNCPGTAVTYSQNPGTVFPIGTTTVTATATDASNNKTTCTFTVTVNDTQAPAITCPSNITVPNDNNVCGATVTFAATATDNCPGTAVTYSQNPGTVFPIGTTTVTATATDASNNTTTCTFTVTVNDTQAPAITCPSNITVPNDNNVCGATVTFAATATDNCPGTAVTYSQNPGTVFPIGTTTVTATATDASNNTTTCTFTVTVNDTQAPAITCPSNITVPNDNNVCGATVTFAATATDNCPGTAVTYSQNPGTVFPIGTTTVTATATDASNNKTTCTFTVTVNDTQAPAITCPSNITVPNDNNVCGATVTFAATATDNCPGTAVTYSQNPGTVFPIGTTTVTATATDASNNKTTCTFTVTVNDTQAPAITCPSNITVPNDNNVCGATVTFAATATDNCPGTAVTYSQNPGTVFPIGTTTVTATATDASNNKTTCTFTVTVNDTQAPAITCPSNITVSNDNNVCGATVTFAATATDNCPGTAVTYSQNPGTVFPIGTTTVTATATDASNNKTTCTFTVTVNDTQAPAITCPSNITVPNDNNVCGATVTFAATATDNCPGTAVTYSQNPGTVFPIGTTTVTATATDASNNKTTCTFTVTVNDTQAPAITCPSNITVPNDNNVCGATVTFAATATDNCPGTAVTYSQNPGTVFPIGTTTVTATATDASNNKTTCTFTVTVNDTQAPAITCPSNITVPNDNNVCGATVTFAATATDNCPGTAVTYSQNPGTVFPIGTTTVTATATDASNNKTTCTFTVTVNDTQAPAITCPSNITVPNDNNVCGATVTFAATATDNCAGTVVTYSQNPGTVFPIGTTTVTATATDASNNTTTCTFTVTVNDTQAPAITCPSNITVPNDNNVCGATVTFAATATDNCPGTAVTYSQNPGTVFPIGTTTVTATATDASNNTTTCTFTVTVNDTQAPAITCPSNITVSNDNNVCGATVTFAATATDNCPGTAVTYSQNPGTVFPIGTTTVTATATDASNNKTTCTFTVTVNDTQAPAITCPSNITVPNDNNVCGATVTFAATATDNCPGTAVTYSQNPGTVFPIGTTTVTATATDASNNKTTCTFTVTVNDTQAPAITCPSNITVPNDNNVCGATVTFAATATDNCPGTAVTYSQNPGTVFPIGTTTVTATATDASNNKTTCTFTVTVNDTQAPAITCPSNITVPNDNNVCGATVTFAATATDNCPGTAVTYSQNPGTVFPIGTTTVTATATDASNNKTTCTFTVTVNDTQAPAITCPSNITVSNDNNVCGATVTFAATATDNCPGTAVTYSQNPGTVFPIGTTTVTATATDASNNKTTCTFTVTVNDTQAPAITCPSNITVPNDNNVCGATVTFAATATDNCPGTAVTYSQNPGTVFPIGTTTVTATATDASNNKTTCTFTVTVNDTQAPAITCPSNITVPNDNNVCGATVTFAATATDNCPGTAVTYSQNPGTVFPIGTTTVTATATDASNNKTTCTFTVTVNDTQAPAITCPSNITVSNDNNVCGATVTFAATATDNCPGTAVTYSQNPGTVFPIGTTTVTATATDASNNKTTCTFTVTVNDTQAPAITCPSNITVPNDNNVCGATVTFAATATDNCPGTAVTYSQNPGTVFPIGTTTVTATATDASNNKTTCTFTVTVNDTQAPAITCPSNITVPNDNNVCGATVTFAATATDNCPGTAVTYSQNPGTVFPIGTTTVTATATDASNNKTTCTFTVTVNDTQAPAITCPSNITVPNDNNVCGVTVTFAATATDNCPGTAVTYSQNPGTVFPIGTTTVTATATDASNNKTTCTFTVTVNDTQAPAITCPSNITVSNDNNVCGATVTFAATATDNCPGTAVTYSQNPGTVFPIGTTTVTATATDASNNKTTCTFTVTVNDTQAPAITCPAPVTVQCAGDVPAPNTALVTASDNCGGTVTKTWVSDVISNQTCANRYTITRTYRAADAGGNSSTCTQTITVNDNTAPVITCPAPVTVQCAGDVPAPNTALVTASDNCGGTVTKTWVSDVITNQTCANRYTITRTYRAADACGNSSTCTQTITVNDNTAPVITCPAPVTVQCASAVPAPNAAGLTATDNCSGTVTKTFVSDVITNQTCANRYTITRTYRATDVCGNSSTCTQTITVNDNTAPVITCPAPLTVQCASAVPPPNAAGLTATDNCSGTVTKTFVSDVITNQTCANRYTITRTYRATDVCGNSSTCTQTITVNDNTAPVITCPANVTVSCGASTLPAATGTATATDNCGGTVTITYSDVLITCSDGTYVITRTWKATDACNNLSTCAQTITVNKIKTAGCFSANITTLSYNGTNTTFTFRVCANGCSAALSHVSFIIGSGIRVVAPLNGSTYQGTHNKYTVSVPVSKNVNGIKYDVIGEGIKNNGECDVFTFILAGDQRNTSITVQFKAGTTTTQAIFNPTQCFCQSSTVTTRTTSDTSTTSPATSNTTITPVVNEPMLKDRKISLNPESFKVIVYPNPSTTDFKIKVESNSNDLIRIRVVDALGRTLATITGVQKNSLVTLGGNYRGGSYFAEVVQGANHKTVKLIKLN